MTVYSSGALEVGRRSPMLFEWFAQDGFCSGQLLARTNQLATYSATSTGSITNSSGGTLTGGVKMPRLIAVDLDLDTVLEAVGLKLNNAQGETCSFPFNARPQALSLYQKLVFNGTLASAPVLVRIGDNAGGTGTNTLITSLTSGGAAQANFKNGGTSHTVSVGSTLNAGDVLEMLTQVAVAAGAVTVTQLRCRNGGAVETSSSTSGGTLFSSWSDASLRLMLAANPVDSAYVSIRVARGVLSFTDFRGA
jgi:hypothetical protein